MVAVPAGVGTGGRVGSGVSPGIGVKVTPVAGSALGGTGVVDGSPYVTSADSGPSIGLSDNSTILTSWSPVAFLSASYWWRW